MSDLISRQKAINALTEWSYDNKDDRDAVDVINGLPPIQSEIVRCKDCKNYKFGMCLYSMTSGVGKLPNGFCDWGERREVTT